MIMVLQVGLLCSPLEVAAEARAANGVTTWVHGPIMQVRLRFPSLPPRISCSHAQPIQLQRLRDADRLLPGRLWYLLVEDARGVGVTADCVQIMLLKVVQAMAARCVVRHLVESRSKEKLCMLTMQWVASVADAPFKSKVDVIDVHGKHMHSNVTYDAKAGPRSAWKATLFAMPGFTEMTVEPLVQRFPTLRAFMQHAREVGQSRAAAELAGMSLACRMITFSCAHPCSPRRAQVRQYRPAATGIRPSAAAAHCIHQQRHHRNVWSTY
jgi:hypothetical protein